MQDQVHQNQDSIRFVWNATPNSKVQQARSVIHPAFHYTPLNCQSIARIQYTPMICSCEAVLNKFCPIDFHMKTIKCVFCNTITSLPQNYAKGMSPQKLAYEFMPNNSTFEYMLPKSSGDYQQAAGKNAFVPVSSQSCFLFVVDQCVLQKQMESIKKSIIKVLQKFPTDGSKFVGLITFSRNVNVYELSSKINTIFCINGSKEYDFFAIMNILGVNVKNDPQNKSFDTFKRFIIQINHKNDINKIIRRVKDIQRDKSILVNSRNQRATGQAINVAISLGESSLVPPRVVFLVGGPCTVGSGTVISANLKQLMRSARDLINGQNIKYFAQAKKYYDSLIKRVINKRIILDLFAFTLEQPGLAEMSELFHSSGGFVVMHEEFSDRIFQESFVKIFPTIIQDSSHIPLVTEGVITVIVSKDVAINGALGHCHSLNRSKSYVSDKMIGRGKTNSWYLGSIDPQKTITILYETKDAETKQQGYFVQLKTQYRDQDGFVVTRVTTVQRRWTSQVPEITAGFDSQAAIVYMARYCVHKTLMEEQKNTRQWLDSGLCKWASYFSDYVKNDRMSFSLPQTMKNYPQFVYHLRRNNFINRFGISLDESFYRAYNLNRESPTNCVTMIEPVLLKYSLDNLQPEAVPLDEQQMQEQVILLLDSYFNVIEWYGPNVQEWYEQKYHESEDYQYIKDFMEAPKQDVEYIMNTRFPVPNYYLTCPNHSKERYLKSRVNPKKGMGQQNQNTITDDSNLQAFNQHLIKVVTTQNLN